MVRKAVWAGLFPAAAALGTLLWGLRDPALWLDESASVVAVRRTWPALWRLFDGGDAPLVPFYALLKAVTGLVENLGGSGLAPELLYRLPSVAAAVVAVWALTTWLVAGSPRLPLPLALTCAAAMMLTAAFSRYGQEARPYAFVLLAAVLATMAWDRMRQHERRWPVLLYALAVALLVVTHLLAAGLIVAHIAAAAWNGGPRGRWNALLRTAAGATLGLLLVAPFAVLATSRGGGPSGSIPVTADRAWLIFLHVFTADRHPFLGVGAILLLAFIGVVQTVAGPYKELARLALCWAVIPVALMIPAIIRLPKLLMGRYLVLIVPGWAILAGLGVATLAGAVAWVVRAALARVTTPTAIPVAVAATVAGLAVLGGATLGQAHSLESVRTAAGHGEDIRPALAEANEPQYAHLPVFSTSVKSTLLVSAYDPAGDDRLVGSTMQHDLPTIWPFLNPDYAHQLTDQPRMVLLMRRPPNSPCQTEWPRSAEYVTHCMPVILRANHYQVETARDSGRHWTFAVVSRERPPSVKMAAVVGAK